MIRAYWDPVGLKQVKSMLRDIKKSRARTITRSALLAGLRVVRNQARKDLPKNLRAARPHIRVRSVKGKGNRRVFAKVGLSVTMNRTEQASAMAAMKPSRPKHRGVGIAGPNFHWATEGTKKRYKKNGQYTGVMPKLVPEYMKRVWRKCKGRARAAIISRARRMYWSDVRKRYRRLLFGK